MNFRHLIGCVLLLLSQNSHALEFSRVSLPESSLTFAYKQMGVPMEGKFKQFSAQIRFDPQKPETAQAGLEIAIVGIDTESAEANDAIVGKPWFNAKTYPTARFVSSGIKSLGGNRYQANGRLTIKGITREIVAPATFTASGTRGAFDGLFTIKRLDYALGEGEWRDTQIVSDEIQIKFHVVAHAVSDKK